MKNFTLSIRTFLWVATFSLAFLSCSKDDNGGGGGSAAQGTIKAKVDGQTVTTMEMTTMGNISNQGSFQILSIQGNDAGHQPNKTFSLRIMGYEGVGTYEFELMSGNSFSMAQYIETTVDPNNPTGAETRVWMTGVESGMTGELKVSELTATHITGTFHFKGKADNGTVKTITDGAFNVKLQ